MPVTHGWMPSATCKRDEEQAAVSQPLLAPSQQQQLCMAVPVSMATSDDGHDDVAIASASSGVTTQHLSGHNKLIHDYETYLPIFTFSEIPISINTLIALTKKHTCTVITAAVCK